MLADTYRKIIIEFEQSGIIDPKKLAIIGDALDVDAILAGNVVELAEMQGGAGLESQTYLAVTYYMISTRSGKLLWDPPPPFENVVDMAVEKIVDDFPIFGEVILK